MIKKLFLLLIILLLVGCKGGEVPKLTSSPTTVPITPSITAPIPTEKPTRNPSPTPIPLINIHSLPSGEYLSYITYLDHDMYLALMSPRGEFKGYLSEITHLNSTKRALSPNLQYLLDEPYLMDLNTGERQKIEELNNCGEGDWSPDNKMTVETCLVPDSTGAIVGRLFLFTLVDHSLAQVTNNSEDMDSFGAKWSPDGQWIAYQGNVRVSGSPPAYDGLHIMYTKCFSSPSTCWRIEPGIDLTGPYSWSPDSQYIAGIYNGYAEKVDLSSPDAATLPPEVHEVRLYQVQAGVFTLKRRYQVNEYITWISWSTDGTQIAVGTGTANYLLSVADGQLSGFTMSPIGGEIEWFRVP